MASSRRRPGVSLESLVVSFVILIVSVGIGYQFSRSRVSVSRLPPVCSRGPPSSVPLVCAHGGLTSPSDSGGIDEENAMVSFTRAVEAHLRCVEVDVAVTSDGHLLALHPKQINTNQHVGDAKGGGGQLIHRRVYQQQRRMLAHIRRREDEEDDEGREIVELHQVLNILCGVLDTLLIDVKLESGMQDEHVSSFFTSLSKQISSSSHASASSSAARTSTQVSSRCGSTRVIVLAKRDDAVSRLARLGFDAGYVVWNGTESNRASGQNEPILKRPISAAVAAVHYTMVTASLVRLVHAIHRLVLAWTVDDAATAVELMHAGVDIFVSSNTLTIESALREEKAKVCAGALRIEDT